MLARALALTAAVACLSATATAQIATFNAETISQLDPVFTQSSMGGRRLEQLIAGDQMQPISDFSPNDIIRRAAKPVGRLTFSYKDASRRPGSCTASLIAPDLIITNHHCVPGDGDVSSALLTLGYLIRATQQGAAQHRVDVRPVEASKDAALGKTRLS